MLQHRSALSILTLATLFDFVSPAHIFYIGGPERASEHHHAVSAGTIIPRYSSPPKHAIDLHARGATVAKVEWPLPHVIEGKEGGSSNTYILFPEHPDAKGDVVGGDHSTGKTTTVLLKLLPVGSPHHFTAHAEEDDVDRMLVDAGHGVVHHSKAALAGSRFITQWELHHQQEGHQPPQHFVTIVMAQRYIWDERRYVWYHTPVYESHGGDGEKYWYLFWDEVCLLFLVSPS